MDNIVLALVIIIILVAHLVIYLWVRFKVDEGVILKFLEGFESGSLRTDALAEMSGLKPSRIRRVCRKSQLLSISDEDVLKQQD